MKVVVNGVIRSLKLVRRERSCSKLHAKAREIITAIFPGYSLYEEVVIPGTRLKFDFFIPLKRIAIEVQGSQHSNYSEFYHGQLHQFKKAVARDNFKRDFCESNDIKLVELQYDAIEE